VTIIQQGSSANTMQATKQGLTASSASWCSGMSIVAQLLLPQVSSEQHERISWQQTGRKIDRE